MISFTMVGQSAPDFTLRDHEGNEVVLSSILKHHLVALVFYPGDDTPGCTTQLCTIRDDWADFQAANVLVYGVNPGNADSHTKFWRHHGLKTPLLIDTEMRVARQYHAVKKFFGHEIVDRTVVLIDQQGQIRFYQRGMPSTKEILAAL